MSLSVGLTPHNSPMRLSEPPVEISRSVKPQIWKNYSGEGVIVTHLHNFLSEPPRYGWDVHHIPFLKTQLDDVKNCQKQIQEHLERALLLSPDDETTIKALKLALEKDTLQIHEYSKYLDDLDRVYAYFS